jgi:hypothetical protein
MMIVHSYNDISMLCSPFIQSDTEPCYHDIIENLINLTSSASSGFTDYDSKYFTMVYPSDWTIMAVILCASCYKNDRSLHR